MRIVDNVLARAIRFDGWKRNDRSDVFGLSRRKLFDDLECLGMLWLDGLSGRSGADGRRLDHEQCKLHGLSSRELLRGRFNRAGQLRAHPVEPFRGCSVSVARCFRCGDGHSIKRAPEHVERQKWKRPRLRPSVNGPSAWIHERFALDVSPRRTLRWKR